LSDPCGRHIMAELYQCNPVILNDLSRLQKILVDAALLAGAEVREVTFNKSNSTQISGVVLISNSHLAIHTFSQQRYASLDIYTFNQRLNPNEAYNYISNQLQASWSLVKELYRGCGEILERSLDTNQIAEQIAEQSPDEVEALLKLVPNYE